MLWRVCTSRARNIIISNLTYVSSYYKMPFYAVAKGRTPGIYMTWTDCENQVKGFSGARYKKFDTVTDAQDFITSIGTSGPQKQQPKASKSLSKSLPSTSNKRTYSTQSKSENDVPKKKSKSTRKTKTKSDDSDDLSDMSDDLSTIITKQMDDIESRLKSFEKGLDKIIKKSTKKSPSKTILIEPMSRQSNAKSEEFELDNDGYVQVYTDGACSSNGRNGARAGLGVYWGDGHPLNISAPVSGRATNNCGEIQAATQAIKTALEHGVQKLAINTDSQFLINSVTKWLPGWKRKGWKLKSGEPVKNEIDFKELDGLQNQLQIKWNYVEAHRGVHGNEMADQLAKAGAALYNTY